MSDDIVLNKNLLNISLQLLAASCFARPNPSDVDPIIKQIQANIRIAEAEIADEPDTAEVSE